MSEIEAVIYDRFLSIKCPDEKVKYYFKYFRRVHEDINYNTQETLTSKSTTHLMNRSVAYLLRGYMALFLIQDLKYKY